MARFMISMPDEMLKKLDEASRKEHRSRSELLREAARRHLSADADVQPASNGKPVVTPRRSSRVAPATVRERLLARGIGQKGCPGLDRLVGAGKTPPDMRRVLKVGKKLTGLSRDIIESRDDRW
jgi:Arc/MetJ-type ribon-helix-helix transcriptional regulator